MPPTVRYWLWMFVGLWLIVMPFVTLEVPVISVSETVPSLAVDAPSPAPTPGFGANTGWVAPSGEYGPKFEQSIGAAALSAPVASTSLSLRGALMLLWCAGLALVLGRLAWTCLRTRRTIARAQFGDPRLAKLSVRAASLFGMSSPPRVGVTVEPVAPFVYGAWDPAVILPQRLVSEADEEQLLAVLAHEFAHVRRRDPLMGWVFALCHALYFFHPALPFVKRQLLLERERACDDWVLSVSKARPSAYARILVAVAELCTAPRQTVPALVASESFQDLKKRLHGLHGDTARPSRLSPAAGVLLTLVGLLMAPGIVFTQHVTNAHAETPALEPTAKVTPPAADPGAETAVSTEQIAAVDTSRSSRAASTNTRTLRFPPDRDVGIVKVRDSSIPRHIDEYWYWNDWEDWTYVGSAKGNVVIPEGKDVWLSLNENGVRDTSFLRNLRSSDIYRISTLYAEENGRSLDDKGMEDVVTLTGLRSLELRYSQVSDRGLSLLHKLPDLEYLQTPRKMTDTGLAHIGRIPTLRGLYINHNGATDTGMVHLEKLRALEEFYVGGGDITDAALVHLTKLPRLSYVMLWGRSFGDAAMLHLGQIPNLKILNASRQQITNRGVQYLAASPSLETLSLYGVKDITGLALQHLSELKTLRKLGLSYPAGETSNLNSYSMSFLAKCTSLEALDAPRSLDDAGLAHIAKLPRLRVLRMWGNSNLAGVTDKGLHSIASIHTLQELNVTGGGITDDGLAAISGLRELTSFSLLTGSEDITDAGVSKLAALNKLKTLSLSFSKRSGITLSALTQLNALTPLTNLDIKSAHQDGSVLDLSPLRDLRIASFYIFGGLHDEDLVCFSGMKNLRWLQGLNGITDAGVAHIAGMTQLDRLGIGGEGVTDAALAQLKGLQALDTLSVEGDFTDAGLRALYGLKGLHWLTLQSETPLSDASQERLIAALPNLTSYNQQALAGAGRDGGFGG
jgi:beta-lactamase regulating signal transducer with metallopeptidase domain